jgi:hypothetical protein
MTTTRINKYSLLTGAILLSLSSVTYASDEMKPLSIPMVDNAQVFADLTDSMPAVLNYFTSVTEEQIIDFYNQNFGESISQEIKRGRLTLIYSKENKTIRVVISQQNNKRQVDVIVEQTL